MADETKPNAKHGDTGRHSELGSEWPLLRRELSLGISHVDLRLYRRTRTSSNIVRAPPQFVYHMRCDWSGEPLPRSIQWSSTGGRPASASRSPRSPRAAWSPRGRRPGSGEDAAQGEAWWNSLPRRYVVRRRWVDIVRFHEALANTLAFDADAGCWRVKAKLPMLPAKGDVDSWTNSYAATGDACALSRSKPLSPPSAVQGRDIKASLADLEGLHWRYVELKLAPYFVEVNKILRELPSEVMVNSPALRRFVLPGSSALRARDLPDTGVQKRFLGPLVPVMSSAEDVAAAVRLLKRTQTSLSAPSLHIGGSKAPAGSSSLDRDRAGGASTAAARLVLSR